MTQSLSAGPGSTSATLSIAASNFVRSPREARRSLTKFITIIVVAFSLEALVMVFEANRTNAQHAIYPTALFAVVVTVLHASEAELRRSRAA